MEYTSERERFGEVIPISDFEFYMEIGTFTSYDGTGYFGTSTHYSIKTCVFSGEKPDSATHVHWFNK